MKKEIKYFKTLTFIVIVVFATISKAQTNYHEILGNKLNAITTAVPFLLIAPDARSGALGDAGVGLSADANSIHYNPAKAVFSDSELGFSMSYSPWLRGLVNDISLAYISGYRKIGDNQAVSASLRYFSLGDIFFTDKNGLSMGQYRPSEFAIDLTYSRKFSDHIAGAVTARYVNSNLTGGIFVGGAESKPGQSVAADASIFYSKDMDLGAIPGNVSFGVNVSNIGVKMSYTENIEKDFIPTNLKLGPSFTFDFDEYNSVTFLFDINKLLVPTPPVYAKDSITNEYVIVKGKDPDRSVVSGIIGSFSDAPDGFSEEVKEFNYCVGVEYWYDKQFALRGGFFYEHPHKGNRKYFTLGAGFRLNVFALDFSYLVPLEQKHPLENTLRFTLSFNFEALKELGKEI